MHKTTKNICLLGSTGSIGTQTLEVIEGLQNRDEYCVLGMSCGKNIDLFIEQIKKFRPKKVCLGTMEGYKKIKSLFPNIEAFFGEEGLLEIASDKDLDILLTGTSGSVALKPTIAAVENGKTIALANKETLVMAGDIVMAKAKASGARVLPVDSEHSAIYQSADGRFQYLNKIVITASGGPFLNKTKAEILNCTPKDALNHPNWHMGKKITIDSATLMNKGLEVIEAHHLFNMPYDKIDVVVHPESIVHSAVEFLDGSVVAQLGNPSMHIPIQYAITYPGRVSGVESGKFSFFDKKLTFLKPDFEKFPCLRLAFEAGKIGGTAPVVLNAANEVCVWRFLRGEIGIKDIFRIVNRELESHSAILNPTLDEIFEVDKEVRTKAAEK